ncbi:hypothetical protein [Mesobacillus maritimus]
MKKNKKKIIIIILTKEKIQAILFTSEISENKKSLNCSFNSRAIEEN